ncbi:MAG TPA: SDR family oxidoreductase [Acetobacteraceae bacterium]|nr:SDR family oxidoreductase [Acetobacteraceae bacterium]
MSSNVALMGIAGRDCYTAAKGGVAALTRSMALEFAAQRVRVNAIAPSATMTERVRKLVAGNASDESRMVTGQVYPVDSGVTIS